MLRQGRDSTRMREIGTLNRSLSMFQVDRPTTLINFPNTIHVSIPDTLSNCGNLGLPIISGWSYRCVTPLNLRNTNGTGWIPVDFTTMFQGSPLASLPVDPVNTVASGAFYVFVTDGRSWTFASLLESERHAPSAARDGGTDFARFEAGNNLSLWASASGLVGYWNFDGTGSIAPAQTAGLRDGSGRGNHGTASNANATGMAFVPGRVGNAVTFDGVDDDVRIGIGTHYFPLPRFTICSWNRTPGLASGMTLNGFFSLTHGLIHAINNLGQFTVRIHDGTAAPASHTFTVTPDNLHNNQWHHLCSTFDGTHFHMFVNGVSRRSDPFAWPGTTNWPTSGVFIGVDSNILTTKRFNGLIDEVRIHNRALTEAEIRTTFNATR